MAWVRNFLCVWVITLEITTNDVVIENCPLRLMALMLDWQNCARVRKQLDRKMVAHGEGKGSCGTCFGSSEETIKMESLDGDYLLSERPLASHEHTKFYSVRAPELS